jgi:predicted nucleic acid-binding protein
VKLVLDTNVLIAALLKSSTTRAILLHPSFEFFLPEFSLEEIRKERKSDTVPVTIQ